MTFQDIITGVYPQNFEWPGVLVHGPFPTYQKDANVIMILEGSYNHLANSAGMIIINWIIKVVR